MSADDVTNCAKSVQFGAFAGDAQSLAVWTFSGEDPAEVRTYCNQLVFQDPSAFDAHVAGWKGLQAASTPSTLPEVVADASLVEACMKRIEWGNFVGEQDFVDVWNAHDGTGLQLSGTCADFVLAEPAAAAAVRQEVANIERFISTPTVPRTVPTTVAIQPLIPQNSCNQNYSGCVPNASDVDCAGGRGNGPAYVWGPVQVLDTDVYDLDGDGDGYGCE